MKNIDNKVKLDSLFKDLNFNVSFIKTIQNILGHSSIMMTERYLANDSKKELDTINKLCFIKLCFI